VDHADIDWLAAVGAGHSPGRFGHRDHLRLAWLALQQSGSLEQAQASVSAAVELMARAHGVPQRYNRTVTDAWVRIVSHCHNDGGPATFADLLALYPWLLDKRLLMRHYTSRTLASRRAREQWVSPDLQPIPG
jgi:hypothetical protein